MHISQGHIPQGHIEQSHIAEGFVRQAQLYPEKTAVFIRNNSQPIDVDRSGSYCYRDLLNAAQAVAGAVAALTQSEADPDKVYAPAPLQRCIGVGLLLFNRIEFLEIFLGVAIAGGISSVLDPQWTASQIDQVLQHYLPELLFVDATLLHRLAELRLPKALKIIVLKPTRSQWQAEEEATPFDRFIDYTEWRTRHLPDEIPNRPIADTDPFYIGFTSGTTGHPKGVIRSHRSWLSSFAASQIEFGTQPDDRILVPGSLIHSLSLYAALECLNAGATLYLLPQFSARAALDCLQTQGITIVTAVPTLLKTIAKAAALRQQTYSTPRLVIAGGAKLAPDLRTELPSVFPKADILEYFGALELSFISLASSREAVPPESVGRPFQGVTVSIRRQDGTEAAVGEVGWIGVKSSMLSAGYCDSEDAAGYRIVEGWATVGDLGWQDADGYLYLAGREQEMLVSGGVNVYPSEIEATLRSLPEIDEVAVFGIPDADRGQAIAAAICWTGNPLTRSELQQRLQATLPRSKCPRYVFTVDRFPRTHSGKIIRAALRQQVLEGKMQS